MNSDEANVLGPDWTTTYRGFGMGMMKSDSQRVPSPTFVSVSARMALRDDGVTEFYGSMPNSSGEQVGARLHSDSTCTGCGKRFATGDVLTAHLAPKMAGKWQHTDCDDPRLEQDETDPAAAVSGEIEKGNA